MTLSMNLDLLLKLLCLSLFTVSGASFAWLGEKTSQDINQEQGSMESSVIQEEADDGVESTYELSLIHI